VWSEQYEDELRQAVIRFWRVRKRQSRNQARRNVSDTGTRGAVTGGKQMDGFADLMTRITLDAHIPGEFIFTKSNELPGYFRPTKRWDFVVVSPKKHLIACIEFKSHVGSFGNNFNNRVEEALGNSVDLNTAYRENIFGQQEAPWLGYLMLAQRSRGSLRHVEINEPHFKAFDEFHDTSYLDRYKILCSKLMKERHYNSACLIWSGVVNSKISYGYLDDALSFRRFVNSYVGYLAGKREEFE
jgi:Restriction endonuclease XhoI